MKLSIIIPVYNAEKYIKECLDSILIPIENKNNIEIILINDGSNDYTKQIIQNYESNKIKLFNNKYNKGVSYSRNYGIEKASGDFIMFVDADDVLNKNWYHIIENSIKEKIYDIVYFSKNLKDDKNKNKMISYIIGNNENNICFAGPVSRIFRRKYIIENNIVFNTELINGEDMLFNLEALLKTKKFKIVSNSFYKYRLVINTATKKFDFEIIKNDMIFHKEIDKVLNKNKVDKEYIKNIEKFCLANGIITILDRLSYLESYKETKKYLGVLKNSPYCEVTNKIENLSKWKKIILFLNKINLNFFIYNILKIKNSIRYKNKQKIIYI